MYLMGFGDIGFLHISNNTRPIERLEDAAGLRVRVMENPISIATSRALGMNPSTMTFGEVYTALQQGVVDGQQHVINVVRNMNFNEVQRYYSLTGDAFSSIAVIVSEAFFDSLPDDLKAVVEEGVRLFSIEQRRITKAQETANLQELKDRGMQINEIAPEELKRFIEATREVRESNAARIAPELYKKILAYLE